MFTEELILFTEEYLLFTEDLGEVYRRMGL